MSFRAFADSAALESLILAAVVTGRRPEVYEAEAAPVARVIDHLIDDRGLTPQERKVARLVDNGRRDMAVNVFVSAAAYWKQFDPTPRQLSFTWGAVHHFLAALLDLIRSTIPDRDDDRPDRSPAVRSLPAPVVESVLSLTATDPSPPRPLVLCPPEAGTT